MEHDFDPKDPKGHEEKADIQSIRDLYKVPLACPACNTLLYNWDNRFFYRHGVCSNCTIYYIEGRDLSPEILNNRKALCDHIKEKIAEKEKKI